MYTSCDFVLYSGFGQLIRQRLQLRLMVFDEHEERIVAWIP
jgi:hypothetical protein